MLKMELVTRDLNSGLLLCDTPQRRHSRLKVWYRGAGDYNRFQVESVWVTA